MIQYQIKHITHEQLKAHTYVQQIPNNTNAHTHNKHNQNKHKNEIHHQQQYIDNHKQNKAHQKTHDKK